MKIMYFGLVVSLAVLVGCENKDSKYDAAMRRLVVERRHYDWIESQIRAIQKDGQKDIDRIEREISENIKNAVDNKSAAIVAESTKKLGETQIKSEEMTMKILKPWLEREGRQLQVVDSAEKALDAVR